MRRRPTRGAAPLLLAGALLCAAPALAEGVSVEADGVAHDDGTVHLTVVVGEPGGHAVVPGQGGSARGGSARRLPDDPDATRPATAAPTGSAGTARSA